MRKRIWLIGLVIVLLVSGCGSAGSSNDLLKNVEKSDLALIDPVEPMVKEETAIMDFSVSVLQNSMGEGENILLSPVSVICALAMTANGAAGETLEQMEEVLGLSVDELNNYLHYYMTYLPHHKDYKVNLANAIWMKEKDGFTVSDKFLQRNLDYYDAGVYKAPFDNSTLKDINHWVKNNTDGMIEDIIDEIPESAIMYLVNAVSFDAKWEVEYDKQNVHDWYFWTENEEKQNVEMMYAEEHFYLEDEYAKGFLKHYKDKEYAFVAILPNEGVSVAEYMQSLTGEHVKEMLNATVETEVDTSMPVFEYEYSTEMSRTLQEMGMLDAFDNNDADFSGLGVSEEGNIFISSVLHKTYIEVGQKGTKAAAASAVVMADGASAPLVEKKEVYLERPFVYMIVDCEHNIPIFIGTLMSVE